MLDNAVAFLLGFVLGLGLIQVAQADHRQLITCDTGSLIIALDLTRVEVPTGSPELPCAFRGFSSSCIRAETPGPMMTCWCWRAIPLIDNMAAHNPPDCITEQCHA